MWPFPRRSGISSATSARRSESASTARDAWIRDADGVGPGAGPEQGLTEVQRAIAVRKSRIEFDKAAVYGGVLDRLIDFVLGDGIVIKAKDPLVDAWLQQQLERGWYGRERKHVEASFIDGERLFTVRAEDRGNGVPIGTVRIGFLDPLTISDVLVNRLDLDEVVQVRARDATGVQDVVLPIVREGARVEPRAIPGSDPEKDRGAFVLGAFWRFNSRSSRGAPVLLRTLDHASDLDNLVGGLVAQLEYVRRLWLHAKVAMQDDSDLGEGSKFKKLKADIIAWATGMQQGEILVTSGGEQGVKVDSFAPDMKLADARQLYDVVLEMCLGGHGIPRHWFGSANDASRTSAAEAGTPVFRAIQSRQSELRACVEQLVRAVLTMGEAAGAQGVTADAEVEVTMATVASRDSERDVREVAALGAALQIAQDRGAISEQEAAKILRSALKSKTFGAGLEGDAPSVAPAPGQVRPAVPGGTMPPNGPLPAEAPPRAA